MPFFTTGMKKSIVLLSIVSIPNLLFAIDFTMKGSSFKGVILYVVSIINVVIPILVSVAFIVFFWGLSKFVIGADNDAEVKKGKEFMLWGILALFILISIRTILGLLSNEFEFGSKVQTPFLPTDSVTTQVDSKLIIDGYTQ